jgi:hypothetical protein
MNLLSLSRGPMAARENPSVPLDPVTVPGAFWLRVRNQKAPGKNRRRSLDFDRAFHEAWEAGTDPAARHTSDDDVFERAMEK